MSTKSLLRILAKTMMLTFEWNPLSVDGDDVDDVDNIDNVDNVDINDNTDNVDNVDNVGKYDDGNL